MISKDRGLFIAIEGLDGAGTTTQSAILERKLVCAGYHVSGTSEPSEGSLGALARRVLKNTEAMQPESLALLFAADRFEHLHSAQGIESSLRAGSTVISDRYVLSSLAYQAAQGVSLEWLIAINKNATVPDLTVFVDTTADECSRRIVGRGSDAEMFDSLLHLELVEKWYRQVLALDVFAGRLVVVNGNNDVDMVAKAVWAEFVRADFAKPNVRL